MSIGRRVRTFLISWGPKARVKHCYIDLSSWYEFRQGIIRAPMCLCWVEIWKSNVMNTISIYIPLWVVETTWHSEELCNHLPAYRVGTYTSRQSERQNIIDRTYTWQQCSVIISEDWRHGSVSCMRRFICVTNHQVGTLVKRHKLVTSPMPPLHSVCMGQKGPEKQYKRYSANFSARWPLAESRT